MNQPFESVVVIAYNLFFVFFTWLHFRGVANLNHSQKNITFFLWLCLNQMRSKFANFKKMNQKPSGRLVSSFFFFFPDDEISDFWFWCMSIFKNIRSAANMSWFYNVWQCDQHTMSIWYHRTALHEIIVLPTRYLPQRLLLHLLH